ncbi:MAG: I78 family peptidase inhibitor [Cereibacter changlensis]|uniref:Peptidase inhibitor I78 n=2 Tax=Cereibacter changlensis TaxID=402884 RepID=A0A2T4JYI0_9RHOB|nr:I78 family peptidase inhibitor [Cereibacter changlensis]PTE22813.1 hypothetical protein C5F48_04975 [Cereibacter changlensis JA139]PZX58746.1 peptidase inhibitor I78 family protein [Cereibacter changlensis]
MRRITALIPLCLVTGLAACQMESPAAPPATPPVENACGAAELQTLVGQPASVLDTMRFSQPTRVITPGMAVTMDFNAERLNIEIDEAKRISRVACG